MKVGIIGAGMAGLACADALVKAGHAVELFDKGRGPGGRMSTRRIETSAGPAAFDHGAQYFTVRDPAFAQVAVDWQARGVAARWPEAGGDAWVGVPGMNAVIRDLASAHAVEFGYLAKAILRGADGWTIGSERGKRGPFDAVVIAVPAEQAAPILALHDFAMARTALHARSQPCWTGMFSFAAPVPIGADVIRDVGALTWAARNNAKPGRGPGECWVVQAHASWSAAHLEEAPEAIAPQLLEAFAAAVATPLPLVISFTAHRWRFALSAGTGLGALWNPELRIGACGDWLLGPRVECAWLSGRELAKRISESDFIQRAASTLATAYPPQAVPS